MVADYGYGITDDFKKIIFDPFTRAEDSTVNKDVGTGLGLAIVKNAVLMHGGTISVENAQEGGLVFDFTLRK